MYHNVIMDSSIVEHSRHRCSPYYCKNNSLAEQHHDTTRLEITSTRYREEESVNHCAAHVGLKRVPEHTKIEQRMVEQRMVNTTSMSQHECPDKESNMIIMTEEASVFSITGGIYLHDSSLPLANMKQ